MILSSDDTGGGIKDMSAHLHSLFHTHTQISNTYSQEKRPFLFYIPVKCCFTHLSLSIFLKILKYISMFMTLSSFFLVCFSHSAKSNSFLCFGQQLCAHGNVRGGRRGLGVFVLTFQSQLVSGAPAICDGPRATECLNPDSINAEAL